MVPPGDPSCCLASSSATNRTRFRHRMVRLAPLPPSRSLQGPPETEAVTVMVGRQSLVLEGALFEGGEVDCRIPAEAGAQGPGVVALFQATSGFAPFHKIDRRQVRGRDRGKAGQRGGEDAYGTAHNQARR